MKFKLATATSSGLEASATFSVVTLTNLHMYVN